MNTGKFKNMQLLIFQRVTYRKKADSQDVLVSCFTDKTLDRFFWDYIKRLFYCHGVLKNEVATFRIDGGGRT